MTWSGVNSLAQDKIDILVRLSQVQVIIKGLIGMGDWELCNNPASEEPHTDVSMINTTSIPDIWLRSRIRDPWFHYFRLWSEALYKLSIDCTRIEVPDVLNNRRVLLEEEYYRDPYKRFGPPRLSSQPRLLLPRLQTQAKILRINIPIFIPAIEDHLNALLNQARAKTDSGLKDGGIPKWADSKFSEVSVSRQGAKP